MSYTRSNVVHDGDDTIFIYPRGDLRRGSALLARWSLAAALLLAALAAALSFHSGALALQLVIAAVITTCIGCIGLATWRLASWRVTLDVEAEAPQAEAVAGRRGVIRMPQGEVDFTSVVAVVLGGGVGGGSEPYAVDVVTRGDTDDGGAAVAALEQLFTPDASEDAEGARGERPALEALVGQLDEARLEIARHAEPLSAWATAETLASTLGVPLIDSCGERTLLRLPHELSLPLGERLKAHDEPPRPHGGPRSVDWTLDEAGLSARWSALSITRLAIAAAAVGGLMLAFQLVAQQAFGFWVVGSTLLLGALVAAFGRRSRLRVDAQGVHLARSWRKAARIPLSELQAVRVSSDVLPTVSLISDARTFGCAMPSAVSARWLSQAIEWAVYRVASEGPRTGPYR